MDSLNQVGPEHEDDRERGEKQNQPLPFEVLVQLLQVAAAFASNPQVVGFMLVVLGAYLLLRR